MEIHPMLVHFPVALLLASVVFDVLGVLRRNERLYYAGYYSLIGGVGGAVLAFASGLYQENQMQERFARMRETMGGADGFGGAGFPGGFPGGDEMRLQMMQLVSVHRLLALAVLVLFLVLLFWRVSRKGDITGSALRSYLVVAVLGAGILTSAAFYGGKLGHERRGGPERGRQQFRMDMNRPADAGFPGGAGSGTTEGMPPQGGGEPQ